MKEMPKAEVVLTGKGNWPCVALGSNSAGSGEKKRKTNWKGPFVLLYPQARRKEKGVVEAAFLNRSPITAIS